MMRLLATTTALFVLGFFAVSLIPSNPIAVTAGSGSTLAQMQSARPLVSAQSTSQIETSDSQVELSQESIDARFAGMLSHVRWLIEQKQVRVSSGGSHSSGGVSATLFAKQMESLSDDISDVRKDLENQSSSGSVLTTPVFSGPIGSNIALGPYYLSGDGGNEGIAIDSAGNVQLTAGLKDTSGDLGSTGQILLATGAGTNWVATSTLGINGTLSNNAVIPDYVAAAGQADEYCLTYELTGDTWEWQVCGGASTFATSSINTSAKLANIVTDETGNGALVFSGSPTLTGILTAASANFSGNVGIGTTTPAEKLVVVGNIRGDRFIGYGAGGITDNTAVGENSLMSNTTGFSNTATGYSALFSNTIGNYNTAVGEWSLGSNISGDGNTALGDETLLTNDTGSYNVAVGLSSLYYNQDGVYNTGVGVNSLQQNTTGTFNTAIGASAGIHITEGSYNTLLGIATGQGLTTGSNNTIIGGRVLGLAPNLSNNIILADGEGNQRINVDANGNVGISTSTPGARLTVGGVVAENATIVSVGPSIAPDPDGWLDWSSAEFRQKNNPSGRPAALTGFAETSVPSTWAVGLGGAAHGNNTSGTLDSILGVYTEAEYSGTALVTNAMGGNFASANYDSGTIANAYGAKVGVYNYDTGTITNGYGLYINPAENFGTFTNNYGLYIADQSAVGSSKAYNIYSVGATSKNFFAGKVGIGTTTPWQELSVSGDLALTGRLYDTSGDAGLNGYVLLSTGTGTNWVATSTLGISGGGSSLFTDGGAVTYLTATGDNLSVGGTGGSARLNVYGNIDVASDAGGISFMGTRYFYASSSNDTIAVGEGAGVNTTGFYNSLFGYQAGSNTSGTNNNIIGRGAGFYNNGSYNNIYGYSAGYSNIGSFNNILGANAANSNGGDYNNFFGESAGSSNSGSYNNFIGRSTAVNNTGNYNEFIGYQAGRYLTSSSSVVIGGQALLWSRFSV